MVSVEEYAPEAAPGFEEGVFDFLEAVRRRFRKVEESGDAAGFEDSVDFFEGGVEVGGVSERIGAGDDVDAGIGCAGGAHILVQENDIGAAIAGVCKLEHWLCDVDSGDFAGCVSLGQSECDVARAAGEVEAVGGFDIGQGPDEPVLPDGVAAEGKDFVDEVVVGGDFGEHLFVEPAFAGGGVDVVVDAETESLAHFQGRLSKARAFCG